MIYLILNIIFAIAFTWMTVQAIRGKYRPSKLFTIALLAIIALDSFASVLEYALSYTQSV